MREAYNEAKRLDEQDPISTARASFFIPKIGAEDVVYLTGNSLGLQPKGVRNKIDEFLNDWAQLGVEGHEKAKFAWMPYHEFLTPMMTELLGAQANEVVVMNSLTVNLHLLFASFYRPDGKRFKIIIEEDAFPSDRYVVASQVQMHGFTEADAVLTWSKRPGADTLVIEDLKHLLEQNKDEVALVFIGGVNYYTGQYFNLEEITSLAHHHGALAGYDLAHAVGNVPLHLHDINADFASWCGYKYLNSGAGGISGIFVHENHGLDPNTFRLAGWWGHNKKTRFEMRDAYDPIPGAEGWQLSNPPILCLAALYASLEVFQQYGMHKLRSKSVLLTGFMERLLQEHLGTKSKIFTPSNPTERGCQLSLVVPGQTKSFQEDLAAKGLIADWREPEVLRMAPVPLYNSFYDVVKAVEIIKEAIK